MIGTIFGAIFESIFTTRWIKLVRDLQQSRARIALMLLSLCAGLFGITTMSSTYEISNREISRNYLATQPASATLKLDRIDASLLSYVRSFPGVASFTTSATVYAEISSTAEAPTKTVRLFFSEDFSHQTVAQIYPEKGVWPPAPDGLLIERTSLQQLGLNLGDSVMIDVGAEAKKAIKITGSVHDPAMPTPSSTIFAYAVPATMQALGVIPQGWNLSLIVSEHSLDAPHIETIVTQLSKELRQRGYQIERIQIPPPGEHPHQGIMRGVLTMLMLFSFLVLLLAAVFNATIIDSLLNQQIRQMAIMKAIGASRQRIATMYLVFIVLLGSIASVLAIPFGHMAGTALSKFVLLKVLNFTLQDSSLALSSYLQLVALGVGLPLLFAASSAMRVARLPAHAGLNHVNVPSYPQQAIKWTAFLDRFTKIDRSLIMALRNSLRQRKRFLLTLTLLSSAGAMFIGALNIKAASQQHLVEAAAERHYQLEVMTKRWEQQEKVLSILAKLAEIEKVEVWNRSRISRLNQDGVEIERSYPDDAHGVLTMIAMPPHSQLMDLKLHSGRMLLPTDQQAIILNQKALEFYPKAQLGDQLEVRSMGQTSRFQLVGIAHQKMVGAVAFITPASWAHVFKKEELGKNFRCVIRQTDPEQLDAISNKISRALADHGIPVARIITETMLRQDVDAHFDILLYCLLFVALLMAIVSGLGLSATMSSNVLERTREFGILRSIGATPSRIRRSLMVETVTIALMSNLLALLLVLPLSWLLGQFLGNLLMEEAFPLQLSFKAVALWLCISIIISLAASLIPARRAAQLSIREAFA